VTARSPTGPVRRLVRAARHAAYGTAVVGAVRAVTLPPGGGARSVGAWLVATLLAALAALAAPLVGPHVVRPTRGPSWPIAEATALTDQLVRSRQRLLGAAAVQRARFSAAVAARVQPLLADVDAALLAAAKGDPTGLGRAREATREALAALRDLAAGTYPAALPRQGLAAAVEHHLLRVRPEVALHAPPATAGRAGHAAEETAYFCVVTLVDDPGGGDPRAVRLAVAGDVLSVRVEYHRAPSVENLLLARDRAEAADGSLGVEATDGWTVTVHLPREGTPKGLR
jgi:hypothetical protein